MDRQFGKLFDHIRDTPALRDNTFVLVCSDNGPEQEAGSSGPFRGFKTHLYEGGIRSPLIVWGPGLMAKGKAGSFNEQSFFAAIDLVPSLLAITGVKAPADVKFDGVALPEVLLGKSTASRGQSLFFRRPPDRDAFYGVDDLPDLAVRDGDWKLLCEYDGSDPQLYNLTTDRSETTNVATQNPDIATRLTKAVVNWHNSMPPDNGPTLATKPKNQRD